MGCRNSPSASRCRCCSSAPWSRPISMAPHPGGCGRPISRRSIVAWTAGNLVTTRSLRPRQRGRRRRRRGGGLLQHRAARHPLHAGRATGRTASTSCRCIVSIHLPTMIMASIILFELFGRKDRDAGACPCAVGRDFLRQDHRQSADRRHPRRPRLAHHRPAAAGPCRALRRRACRHRRTAGAFCRWGSACAGSAYSGNVRLALVLSALKLFLMPAARSPWHGCSACRR